MASVRSALSQRGVTPAAPRSAYPQREEIAHAVTHGLGALLAVAGLVFLLMRAAATGHPLGVVSSAVYGASLILLFSASTLYHASPWPRAKRALQKADHVAIYLLIAGTYTPFSLVSLRGAWGWSIFGVIWGLAVAGILFELLARQGGHKWSLAFYIGMGWVIVVAVKPLVEAVPNQGLVLLAIGGLCYTGGAVFYAMKSLAWHHAIWHVFVLGGSAAHFFGVYYFVLVAR